MSRQALSNLDKRIAAALGAVGLVDQATIRGKSVAGYYVEEFTEQGGGEDAMAGMDRTFDCRLEDLPAELLYDEIIAVAGYGEYRYLRAEPYGNGRVILLLGTIA